MKKIGKLIAIQIFFLFVILFIYGPLSHAQEETKKHVLVLNSYHKGFLWTDNIVKGIESVLEQEKNNIELKIEYMDTKATGYKTEYKERLYDLYKYKYGNKKFDLIISTDDNAFDFLREYHKNLFFGVPIVFCGVNNLDAPNIINKDVFTGMIEHHSIRETINIALSLHPGTGQIVFVVDNTPSGVHMWKQIQGLFKYYEDIRMTRIDNSLSMEQIEDKVSKLSDNVIVYWGTFHRDKFGNFYSFKDGSLRVSKVSSRPLYGHSGQLLPYGIVGGKLLGGFYQGQIATEMAQRILRGEKVRDIPVLTEPQTRYMFNYEQMKRWGIKVSDLPEGSVVINQPYSFYEENRVLIWCIIATMIFQMLIIISLVMNIARRKKAEKDLNISEENFRKLLEYLPVATAILDKNKNTEYANRKYEETIGYNSKNTNVADWFLLAYPDDEYRKWALEKWNVDVKKALREGKEIEPSEYNITCKDGKVRVMEISGAFVADKMIAIFNDITERKQTEEALKESEEKLRNIIEHSTNVFYSHTPEHVITYMSPQVKEILGYEVSEVMIRWTELASDNPVNEKGFELTVKAIETGKPQPPYKLEFIHKSGKKVWIEVHEGPVVVDEKTIAIVGAFTDITERKQAEEELAKHHENLEGLVQERTVELEKRVAEVEQLNSAMVNLMDDLHVSNKNLEVTTHQLGNTNKELEAFAYSVSHDLRSPLRSIDGFSQILLEDYSGILDKQGRHYLQRVRAGTQNMGQLIDDILRLSRSGRHSMDKKTINMESIVREVCKSFANELKNRKVDFVVHECPPVFADSHLVKIMFTNLLSNALKFTGIRENAKIETGSMAEEGHTVFFIKDNGAGFDMQYADKLFIPFQRLHRAEKYEGSGIGLAIVQRIIHRHGGRIWAESKINVGTTFYFTLTV